jgi:choline dehydrogenase
MAAPFSAIIMVGALVLPDVIVGITEASMTRSRSSPITRRIVAQPALAKYKPVEYLPGSAVGDDDAALIKAAGDIGTTIFHPVGTAKMGRPTDPMAVVDERLRLIGLERLRVIDASVMPTITSGNTNAPTMMIAEKGAAMILEDRRP